MLSIANPANGQGFFSLLYKYNWVKDKDMVGLTKDKVHSIATAKICADRYLLLRIVNLKDIAIINHEVISIYTRFFYV